MTCGPECTPCRVEAALTLVALVLALAGLGLAVRLAVGLVAR